MSVLAQKRTVSKAEFINVANQIYVETMNFLTRLSARYSRLIAEPVAKLAGEVKDHSEKANSIFPSDAQRVQLRTAHLLEARASLMESGKIRVNGSRDGVKRARRKLKLFYREFKEEKRDFKSIEQYMECQSAYYRSFDDHGRLLRLRRLYHAIFFGGATECSKSSKAGLNSA